MRIVVCVKQIPDPTIVKYNIETRDLENVCYIMDPVDEVAVSAAIRIREKNGGEVTAMSLGPPRAEEVLKCSLRMGVDRAIHLCDDSFDSVDEYTTSVVLSHAISSLQYDLVLCGKESMDEGNGFLGAGLAEWLDLPLVTNTTRIDIFADTHSAVVHRRVKGGDREILESPLPAVFTVEAVLASPVYPPLRTILAGKKKEVTRLDARSLGIDLAGIEPAMMVLGVSQPKPRLKKTATIDSSLSPAERMRLIAAGGVQQKSSKTVQKLPKAAAADILQFLLDNGIVTRPN
jgi:electron transfer flavoprotein beta subunit